jgi:hypothetical protein
MMGIYNSPSASYALANVSHETLFFDFFGTIKVGQQNIWDDKIF